MRPCPRCGAPCADGAGICGSCGTALPPADQAAQYPNPYPNYSNPYSNPYPRYPNTSMPAAPVMPTGQSAGQRHPTRLPLMVMLIAAIIGLVVAFVSMTGTSTLVLSGAGQAGMDSPAYTMYFLWNGLPACISGVLLLMALAASASALQADGRGGHTRRDPVLPFAILAGAYVVCGLGRAMSRLARARQQYHGVPSGSGQWAMNAWNVVMILLLIAAAVFFFIAVRSPHIPAMAAQGQPQGQYGRRSEPRRNNGGVKIAIAVATVVFALGQTTTSLLERIMRVNAFVGPEYKTLQATGAVLTVISFAIAVYLSLRLTVSSVAHDRTVPPDRTVRLHAADGATMVGLVLGCVDGVLSWTIAYVSAGERPGGPAAFAVFLGTYGPYAMLFGRYLVVLIVVIMTLSALPRPSGSR